MFTYDSGEEIKAGDVIRYHGDPGRVEFIVSPGTTDPALVWYLEQNPNGGAMLELKDGWGRVFVSFPDEDLDLVSRAKWGHEKFS